MSDFKQYRRTQIAEMTPWVPGFDMTRVSVSLPDGEDGSPKAGDMIARNPKNHADMWLIAAAYFADNFGAMDTGVAATAGLPATEAARVPKVRTSHHRNKEEAARLQAVVDQKYALTAVPPLTDVPDDPYGAFAYFVSHCASGLYRELVEKGKSDTQARLAAIHCFLDFASGEACRIARREGREPNEVKWQKATKDAFDRTVKRTSSPVSRPLRLGDGK